MNRQNHTQFEIGQRVHVSDGAAMPPARFNRKLADWKHRNYIGRIKEIEEERSYSPYGSLVLSREDYPANSVITFTFHIQLGGHLNVDIIAEEEAAA